MGVTLKRRDQRLGHIFDHADFIRIAVLQKLRNIPLKLNPCVYYTVTKEVVSGDAQSVCETDNSGQADFCGAGFHIADVRRGKFCPLR